MVKSDRARFGSAGEKRRLRDPALCLCTEREKSEANNAPRDWRHQEIRRRDLGQWRVPNASYERAARTHALILSPKFAVNVKSAISAAWDTFNWRVKVAHCILLVKLLRDTLVFSWVAAAFVEDCCTGVS